MNKLVISLSILFVASVLLLSSAIVASDSENTEREKVVVKGDVEKVVSAGNMGQIIIKREIEREDGGLRLKIEEKRKIIDEKGREREIKLKIEEIRKNGELKKRLRVEKNGEEFEIESSIEINEEHEGNRTRIKARLSNGANKEIKVMPDRASQIALERLRSMNISIELIEIMHKKIPVVVYNIEANKTGRFLGIFKMKLKLIGQIDSETGEFIKLKKPWWVFFVSGEDEFELGDKVDICHTPRNETAAHTINVASPAIKAHLAHGDYLGKCEANDNGEDDEDADEEDNETEEGNETLPDTNETIGNKTFILTGENFKFIMNGTENPELRVNEGDTVKIEFTSSSGSHNWAVDEFNVSTNIVDTGNSSSVEFVASQNGTFEYYCGVGEHRAMGMKGSLVVE